MGGSSSKVEGRVLIAGLANARPFALRACLSAGPDPDGSWGGLTAEAEELARTLNTGSGTTVLESDGVLLTLLAADSTARGLWHHYFETADAVVLVLEGGGEIDEEELAEAWRELQRAARSFGT